MNPEYKKYLPALYIAGGVLLLIAFVSWLISPKYDSYQLHTTHFKNSHFLSIQNDKLYAYSGAGFYSVNPKDPDDVTVLSSGMRLPEVKKLVWAGDSGALVTFGDAQSDSSEVTSELASMGQPYDETTKDYVWFVDFKTNKLSPVSTAPLSSESVYYSASQQGLYFSAYSTEGSHGDDEEALYPLSFYSIASKKTQTIVDDMGHEKVSYMGQCVGDKVCIVQDTGQGKQVLWTAENGSKKTLADAYDKVLPTNDPSVFVAEKNQPVEKGEGQEDALSKAGVFVLNLALDKTTKTDLLVSVGANIIANAFDDGKKIAVIDESRRAVSNVPILSAVSPDLFGNMKSKEFPLSLKGGDKISEDILASSSRSPDGVTVLTGSEDNVFIMGPPSYSLKSDKYDGNKLGTTLKPCFDKYTKYHKYTSELGEMMVGVIFDDKFQQNVGDFSRCIDKTDKKAFVGQSYTFVGLSPIDGRFVTN